MSQAQRMRDTKRADALFSSLVRKAPCRALSDQGHRCEGPTECAHVIRRGFKALRWDFENAICLCRGAHRYHTEHPSEWKVALSRWGIDREALSKRSTGEPEDPKDAIARMRG